MPPLAPNPFAHPKRSSSAAAQRDAIQAFDSLAPLPIQAESFKTADAEIYRPLPPEPTRWTERVRAALHAPASALSSAYVYARTQSRAVTQRTERSWYRMRAELGLLALRAHGIVVHRTRGRAAAILLVAAPLLIVFAAAGLYFSKQEAVVTQAAIPAIEVMPTEADIARILRSRTGFTVLTEPAGARVSVDGRSTGHVTPERVSGFAPGLHSIELKKAGYYDVNLAAVLEEGSTLVLPPVILRSLPKEHEDPAEQ